MSVFQVHFSPPFGFQIVQVGAHALFDGLDLSGHNTLWITDGTAANTSELVGIGGAAANFDPHDLIAFNGQELFSGVDSAGHVGLWVSNGTVGGTSEITAGIIQPGAPQGLEPHGFAVFSGGVLFNGFGANEQPTLWITDGTPAGTHEITGIANVSSNGLMPDGFATFNNEVLFHAWDTNNIIGLWVSDGTATGTHEITGIAGVDTNGFGFQPGGFTVLNGEVVFSGIDTAGKRGLWVTDGTAAGTHELTGINGVNPSGLSPNDMTLFNDEVVFAAPDDPAHSGLWVSDGTAAGTHELTGINGASTSLGISPGNFAVFNGELIFSGFDTANEQGIWVSDGTVGGTHELTGIPGVDPSIFVPAAFTVLNGEVLFTATNASGQRGLWVTDGIAVDTHELTPIGNASTTGLHGFDYTPMNAPPDFDLVATLSSNSAVEGTPISVTTVTDDGTDAKASATYRWMVDTGAGFVAATGPGAATATYTPTEGDEGGTLEVVVSALEAFNPGSIDTTTVSAGTVQESASENASFAVAGLLDGQAVPNHPLTAAVTEPDAPASGIAYTWKLDGVTKLTGLDAAAKTFTPQAGDAGKSLTLTVSFTDTHGFTETGTGLVGNVASAVSYDLNGDRVSDFVFQNNGQPGIWLWNGTAPTAEVGLPNPGASWRIVTSRDVNGDGNADLIWQNSDGTPGIWFMNGTTPLAEVGLTDPGASWHLVAGGDVNGDARADLIWQNADGTLGVWEMNGATPIAEAGIGNPGASWKVVGTADDNGDGRDDILLQDTSTGNLMIDLMNGTSVASSVSIAVGDPSWHAVSTGEFNGQAEIAWQNTDGTPGLWLMNGTAPVAEAALTNPGPGWQLVSIDHFTPGGGADLLFQNTSGALMLWQMNGTSVAAKLTPPDPGSAWQSVNGHPFAAA